MNTMKGTKADLDDYAAKRDKLLGYPSRGVQVGGGIHVALPVSWNGLGNCPPGWTATHSRVDESADKTSYETDEGRELVTVALTDARASRLTPAERAALIARLDAEAAKGAR